MGNDTYICPNANAGTCTIYNNWSKKRNDQRLNVIFHYWDRYECLPIIAHEDSCNEGGVEFNNEIRRRIDDNRVRANIGMETGCLNIKMLNLLETIEKKISGVLK